MESPEAGNPAEDLKWKARPEGSAKGHAQLPLLPHPFAKANAHDRIRFTVAHMIAAVAMERGYISAFNR